MTDEKVGALCGVVAFFAFAFGFLLGSTGQGNLKREAIERGYAIYCPVDGRFNWIENCKEPTP